MGDGIGAYSLTVADLLRKQVAVRAESMAVEDARGALSYQALDQRVNRLAHVLVQHGVAMGDRVALLSENRREYLETQLAAAKLGAIVACLNWRLADAEMTHCVRLVSPRVVLVSARHAPMLARIDHGVPQVIDIDARYEGLLATAPESDPQIDVDPAQGLVILYTSGTTGVP
ncbi:MAG: AMP-binding protein, partial [Polaromonas sp.]|nr:AMP-binding protein [Polaromonas sp.]